MSTPEMFTVPLLELRVITQINTNAAYIATPQGESYPEPMIVLEVFSASALDDIETPVKTYFAMEPQHAGEFAVSLARSADAAIRALKAQQGRPNT